MSRAPIASSMAALLLLFTACDSGADDSGADALSTPDVAALDASPPDAATRDGGVPDAPAPDGPTPDAAPPPGLEALVAVPETFAEQPLRLVAYIYPSLPAMGPPSAIGGSVDRPDIAVGVDYELTIDDVGIRGRYFVFLALYVEGGGDSRLAVGKDYFWTSEQVTFGSEVLDLGRVELYPYFEDF